MPEGARWCLAKGMTSPPHPTPPRDTEPFFRVVVGFLPPWRRGRHCLSRQERWSLLKAETSCADTSGPEQALKTLGFSQGEEAPAEAPWCCAVVLSPPAQGSRLNAAGVGCGCSSGVCVPRMSEGGDVVVGLGSK